MSQNRKQGIIPTMYLKIVSVIVCVAMVYGAVAPYINH